MTWSERIHRGRIPMGHLLDVYFGRLAEIEPKK